MWLTRDLLNVLACPRCRGPLELRGMESAAAALSCDACERSYPIVHDIPNFMPDQDMPDRNIDPNMPSRAAATRSPD
jgi:uncharacterized protein